MGRIAKSRELDQVDAFLSILYVPDRLRGYKVQVPPDWDVPGTFSKVSGQGVCSQLCSVFGGGGGVGTRSKDAAVPCCEEPGREPVVQD